MVPCKSYTTPCTKACSKHRVKVRSVWIELYWPNWVCAVVVAFDPFEVWYCHRLARAREERTLHTNTCAKWLKKDIRIQNKIQYACLARTGIVDMSFIHSKPLYGSYFYISIPFQPCDGMWMCARAIQLSHSHGWRAFFPLSCSSNFAVPVLRTAV